MSVVSMKELLESGVHFGHRTHKWNPKMKPYIFTERNQIHIIDLQKTVKALEEAYAIVAEYAAKGGTVLFVGTKRQAQETIQLEATRCGMPWVTARWLGGTMTNWITIRQRINELERLERMRDKGEFSLLTKKEALGLERKIERLDMLLGGIRNMVSVPDLLFIVDVRREITAVHEANLLNVPIVAMVDTNCDPNNVDYIIPSNDDAIRAIKLVVGKIADAVLEGQAMRKDFEEEGPTDSAAAFDVDSELTDEDLLGDATIAKLKAQRAEEEALEKEYSDEDDDFGDFEDFAMEEDEEEEDVSATEEDVTVEDDTAEDSLEGEDLEDTAEDLEVAPGDDNSTEDDTIEDNTEGEEIEDTPEDDTNEDSPDVEEEDVTTEGDTEEDSTDDEEESTDPEVETVETEEEENNEAEE